MFRNKAFGAKLAAALTLVALLSVRAVAVNQVDHPSLGTILLQVEKRDGTRVEVREARVVSSDPAGFVVEEGGFQARVTPAAPVAPGDRIALAARVDARSSTLRLEEVRRLPEGLFRPYGGLLSIGIVLLVAGNFLRHFAWRPSAVRVEGVPE